MSGALFALGFAAGVYYSTWQRSGRRSDLFWFIGFMLAAVAAQVTS